MNSPIRLSRGELLGWGLGIALVLMLGAAFWVFVPVVQLRLAVRNADYKSGYWVNRLGGPERARQRLTKSFYQSTWLAPDRDRTAYLMRYFDGGEEVLVAVLLDPAAPEDSRLSIADAFCWETDNNMDKQGMDIRLHPVTVGLTKALEDPSGRVRVAAARALWSQEFTASDDAGLEALVRFLKEPNAQVRLAAARALHEIVKGPMPISERAYRLAAIAEPALKEALKDPDPAVRAEAAEALKHQFARPVRRWDGNAEPAEPH